MLKENALAKPLISEIPELGSLLATIMEPALVGGLSENDADSICERIVDVFQGHHHALEGS
jgi:hypothetical protein